MPDRFPEQSPGSKQRTISMLEAILDSALVAILTIDRHGIIQTANPATSDMFGYSCDDLIGQDVKILMPIAEGHRHGNYIQHHLETGERKIIGIGREVVGSRCDGSKISVHLSVSKFIDDGETYFAGILMDLTERDRATGMLTTLGHVIESSANEVFIFDSATLRFTLVNKGARDNLGYSDIDLRAMTPIDIIPTYTRDSFAELVAPLRSGAQDRILFETAHQRYDGSFYDVLVTLQFSNAVEPPIFVAIAQDLTEERQAQQRLGLILEASTDGWWDRDLRTGDERWSKGLYEALGYGVTEIVASEKALRELLHPEDRLRRDEAIKTALRDHRGFRADLRYRHKNGSYNWFRSSGAAQYDAAGAALRMTGTLTNVTEEIEKDVRLRSAQQLESIGQLSGGIAHDFNNLLTVIIGNLELIQLNPTSADAQTFLSEAIEAASIGARLTDRLLSFARRKQLDPVVADINEVLSGLAGMLRRLIGFDHQLSTSFSPGLWLTRIDKGQIENALVNLVLNARDAMPDGGRVTVETDNVLRENVARLDNPDARQTDFVCLSVSDTGIGMSKDVLDQAIRPFFSTKAEGRGTGLGLSSVHGFVEQSGGFLQIESASGAGTTVRVYLPRARPTNDQIKKPEHHVADNRTKRILVVEDDPLTRRTTKSRLEELGYLVTTAADGRSALKLIETDPPVDLVFTDVIMPGGVSGPELCRRLQILCPQIKLLMTSGYVGDDVRSAAVPNIAILQKPYTIEKLKNAIARALN